MSSAGRAGFTLLEVMVALAIIALVSIMLLGKRMEVVSDAGTMKDLRIGWTLGAWKMGEIERDDKLFLGEDRTDSGTFEDYADHYREYTWEYEAKREKVETNNPEKRDEQPAEIFRVKLQVRGAGPDPLAVIEGLFPVQKPATAAPAPPPK